MDRLLPVLEVPSEKLGEQGTLDPSVLFNSSISSSLRAQRSNLEIAASAAPPRNDDKRQTWMEIGFGNGDFLASLIKRHPEINFLGAEPFINGMAGLLKKIKDDKPDNIRVLMDDAMLLVRALKDNSLDRLYILNPDPWPKKRHHKRRIVSPENLDQFARVLKPGAQLVTATDVDDMAEWIVTQCANHPAYEWTAETPQDWLTPPPEWIRTRFAEKGREKGHTQRFLVFNVL